MMFSQTRLAGSRRLKKNDKSLSTGSAKTKSYPVLKALQSVQASVFIKYIILFLGAGAMMIPFLWMVLSSVKGIDQIFTGSFLSWPEEWHWDNYAKAWDSAPFGRFFLNSFLMSIGIVLGQIITCALAAYAFSWIDFQGKKVMFIAIIATTIIPFESTMIPSYLVIKELGWMNSYAGLIIPGITSVFGIFLLRQFFLTIPKDFVEAARMDGCSHLRILIQIILPLAGTVLATLSLFAFLGAWNSYLWPLLITNSADMRTVQIGLRYMVDKELGTQWPQLMAASTFIIVPVMIVFLTAQKYFIRGVMHSGVK
ncbi:MAG: transporter permease [Paenibacillus sp.]|jgi:multiple sugar transport system permease protein|nr:transporter permease [Paenibacillus sp.]